MARWTDLSHRGALAALLLAAAAAPLAAQPVAQAKARPPLSSPTASGPMAVIGTIADELGRTLVDRTLTSAQRRARVVQLLDAHIEFPVVAKLVLAKNWTRFSEDQRARFTGEFKSHLIHTYWKSADQSGFQFVEITTEREESYGDWVVKTMVHATCCAPVAIDYRLRNVPLDAEDGTTAWRIIDVTVEGVSLVSNFRSQFQGIVSNEGPDGLLRMLAGKNTEAAAAFAESDKAELLAREEAARQAAQAEAGAPGRP